MLGKKRLTELQEYVDRHINKLSFTLCESPQYIEERISESSHHTQIEAFIKNTRQPTFNEALFCYIHDKGVSDLDIYKKAEIDRRHFSKIRSNLDYRPGKNTAIALAIALELNRKETDKLLKAAGYSLSESDTFDLVIQFCLEKKNYDIHDVNQALDYFSLKPLAGTIE